MYINISLTTDRHSRVPLSRSISTNFVNWFVIPVHRHIIKMATRKEVYRLLCPSLAPWWSMSPFIGQIWQIPACGQWQCLMQSFYGVICPIRTLVLAQQTSLPDLVGNFRNFTTFMCGNHRYTFWTKVSQMATDFLVGNLDRNVVSTLDSPSLMQALSL